MKPTMRSREQMDKSIKEYYYTSNPSSGPSIEHLLTASERAAIADKFKKVYEYDLEREPEPTLLQPSKSYISAMEAMMEEHAKSRAKADRLDALYYGLFSALPLYQTVKEKNGTPTVVAINGNRYVLDNRHPL